MNLELALIETLSSARRGNEPHMKNITSLGQLSQRIRLANENIVMAEKEKELGQ